MQKVLFCISSKTPNLNLYTCIGNLYKSQITNDFIYKICIVDSDSETFYEYDKVKRDFPDVEILYAKNKNYEFGAYKYAYNTYPNYDIYICIQDTIIFHKKIDLSVINDKTVYTIHNFSGYYSEWPAKPKGIEMLRLSGLAFEHLIDTEFCLAMCNSYIVSKNVLSNLLDTFQYPPENKLDACMFERNVGLYFTIKEIYSHNLEPYVIKIITGRQ